MTGSPRRARRLVPVVLLIAWLGIGGALGPFAGRLGEVATNDQASFLPRSAESTEVIDEQKVFRQSETLPAVVVWTADGGTITEAQKSAATGALASLADAPGVTGRPSPAVLSQDREALQGVVPLSPSL